MADPITDDLSDMFPDTVSHRPLVSTDAQGAQTFGSSTDYDALVVGENREVRGEDGQVQTSTLHVVVPATPGFKVDDEYTLPARYSPRKPEAVAVRPVSDENGPHHEVVFFK